MDSFQHIKPSSFIVESVDNWRCFAPTFDSRMASTKDKSVFTASSSGCTFSFAASDRTDSSLQMSSSMRTARRVKLYANLNRPKRVMPEDQPLQAADTDVMATSPISLSSSYSPSCYTTCSSGLENATSNSSATSITIDPIISRSSLLCKDETTPAEPRV
jgi:hypothetical protein